MRLLVTGAYRRDRATAYAERYASSRNPLFSDFEALGGDCTNFVSQCVYAGSCRMNLTPVFGWYYLSIDDRAPAFTGVEFFYNFLVGNEGVGPFGSEQSEDALLLGDVIQLGRAEGDFYHSLLLVGRAEDGTPLVAAHSEDAYARPLSEYRYDRVRYLHIEGVRYSVSGTGDCYAALFEGRELLVEGAGLLIPS